MALSRSEVTHLGRRSQRARGVKPVAYIMRAMWIAVCMIVFAIAACAVRQSAQMQTQFDYDAHKPYTHVGTNTIKGQGFLRQQGGGIVTCAGNDVILWPATAFFREMITHIRAGKILEIGGSIDPVKGDPSYKAIRKQAQCDAQGNFLFSNLPNGNWLVLTLVTWRISSTQQGGVLLREVTVSNGDTTQVLLTDKDFIGR